MNNLIKRTPGQMMQELKNEAYLTMAEIQTGSIKFSKMEKGIITAGSAMFGVAGCASPVFAAGGGNQGGATALETVVANMLGGWYGKLSGLAIVAFALVAVICALIGILGDDQDAQKAKTRIKRAAVCLIAILLMGSIINLITTSTSGHGWEWTNLG